MLIQKKVWPEYFQKIMAGDKTFEVRLADFDCAPGDTLVLREWNPAMGDYTGSTLEKHINCVIKTKELIF